MVLGQSILQPGLGSFWLTILVLTLLLNSISSFNFWVRCLEYYFILLTTVKYCYYSWLCHFVFFHVSSTHFLPHSIIFPIISLIKSICSTFSFSWSPFLSFSTHSQILAPLYVTYLLMCYIFSIPLIRVVPNSLYIENSSVFLTKFLTFSNFVLSVN